MLKLESKVNILKEIRNKVKEKLTRHNCVKLLWDEFGGHIFFRFLTDILFSMFELVFFFIAFGLKIHKCYRSDMSNDVF